MATIDPEKERQRLAKVYAEMSDSELEKLATEVGSLTDTARELLQAEVARRGMEVRLRDATASVEKEKVSRLVTLRQYMNVPEALLAKSVLDSAGIECFLFDENIVRIDWFWSNVVGGVKLRVREEDAASAASILDQHHS